jgi:hypothetical protein
MKLIVANLFDELMPDIRHDPLEQDDVRSVMADQGRSLMALHERILVNLEPEQTTKRSRNPAGIALVPVI